jgi:hypothetical protein
MRCGPGKVQRDSGRELIVLVRVVVLVLEKTTAACQVDRPSSVGGAQSGGEPLCKIAALWVCSRRLPGITQRSICAQRYRRIDTDTPKSLQNLEPFPGAACCDVIELATYKAAPLQSRSASRC